MAWLEGVVTSCIAAPAIGISFLIFRPCIQAARSTRAGANHLKIMTGWWICWYLLLAIGTLYAGCWSFLLMLTLAACCATGWSDSLFLLIHHMWSRWLVVLLTLATIGGYGLVPWMDAAAGILYGYGLLWLLRTFFLRLRQLDALGQGDPEFICVIALGSGLYGTWATLLGASLLGICLAMVQYIRTGTLPTHMPLGAYLALIGSICILLYQIYL
jgi:prepilin signal peptidase PulO-like enzyme (type II secretory pathway)